MALAQETLEDTEFAKQQVMSLNVDQTWKKQMMRLLNTSVEATNGITVEEKIQKITEIMHGLVVSQVAFINSIDRKIEEAAANRCRDCKAMKHAEEIDYQKRKEQIIKQWKAENGIKSDDASKDSDETTSSDSWMDVVKKLLLKPGIWIFGTVLVISPYGVDILKTLLEFFSK